MAVFMHGDAVHLMPILLLPSGAESVLVWGLCLHHRYIIMIIIIMIIFTSSCSCKTKMY